MATKKTEIKRWHVVVFCLIIVAAVAYKIYSLQWPTAVIAIDGTPITVLVADTEARQIQGWSDKKDMGKYGGMLFAFGALGQHTMVMRDMEFPLDIVWIAHSHIVDIAPNLPPEWHIPEDQLVQYSARAESSAVLELPAGFAAAHGFKIGDSVTVGD